MSIPLRHGIFLAPFHGLAENPTLAMERDLQLCVLLDELGFDEAWIGEHHSAGSEIIVEPGEYRERLTLKDHVRIVSRVPRRRCARGPGCRAW